LAKDEINISESAAEPETIEENRHDNLRLVPFRLEGVTKVMPEPAIQP
jgi:hypothetical protein